MADGSIRFFTDLSTAGFESGAKRLQSVSASTAASVKGAFGSAAASIASLAAPLLTVYTAINSVRNALNMTDRLSELSKSTGEAAGNLAVLERAFQNTGIGAEKVGPMFAKMSSFISDLAAGTPKAQQTAEALGVTLEQLKGKTPTQNFQILLQAVAGVADANTRAALSGDIWGDKMGYKLVPFARDFNAEMANASAELGSTVRLLNENATGIENMGDKFAAISGKLTEFTIGLASGTAGANNLVEAISKIDAAGLGERLGQALRAAFAAPMEILQGVGDFLISGIAKAGNALVAAFKYAFDYFSNLLGNSTFWSGIGDRIQGALAKVGEGFALLVVNGLKQALDSLKNIPFFGEFAEKAVAALDKVKESIIAAGEVANIKLFEGANKIEAATKEARNNTKYVYEDIFNAAKYTESSQKHWENARRAAAEISKESDITAKNFGSGSAALTNALNAIRGFNLGGSPPLPKPGAIPQPQGGPLAPPGGGGELPPPATTSAPGGGGGGGAFAPVGNSASTQMQTAMMRANAAQQRANQRASEYIERGMYGSAVSAQQSGQRAFNRIMEAATVRDLSSQFQFSNRPATNAGEALSSIKNQVGGFETAELIKRAPGYNPNKGELENFKNALKQGAFSGLTPQKPGGSKGGGGAGSGGGATPPGGSGAPKENPLQQLVTDIYNLLDERLPIQALV